MTGTYYPHVFRRAILKTNNLTLVLVWRRADKCSGLEVLSKKANFF